MIEYTMLILLGICIGGLVAFLFAPSVWHRAVRLTTRRLEATMPMSLSEIEADKDLLRASYAVRIRRLEAGLNAARDKSANQLVEISRHQMEIAELRRHAARLNAELEERRNAASVFETTIRKRLPELERLVASANSALDERSAEVEDMQRKLERREDMLQQVQRSAAQHQEEVNRLRAALERQGEDRTGRFKRRTSEWGLEEYRSEYDRLNLEMSRMREKLAQSADFEARQISVLKREMQQLAEQILTAAAQPAATGRDWRQHEAGLRPEGPPAGKPASAPRGQRQGPVVTAKPWPGSARNDGGYAPKEPPAAQMAAKRDVPGEQRGTPAETAASADTATDRDVPASRSSISSLLGEAVMKETGTGKQDAASMQSAEGPHAAGIGGAQAETAPAETEPATDSDTVEAVDSRLDKLFRNMIDDKPGAASQNASASAGASGGNSDGADGGQTPANSADDETSRSAKTLVDRLRIVQERQTG